MLKNLTQNIQIIQLHFVILLRYVKNLIQKF